MATKPLPLPTGANDAGEDVDGRLIIQRSRSSEIFFAVVGPVGAGASRAREALERACRAAGYTPQTVKVSAIIREWGAAQGLDITPEMKPIEKVKHLQNVGDEMRKADPTRIARAVLSKIASLRAELNGEKFEQGTVVPPGDKKIAYLIDSVRHPAETSLFRRTYASAFALVGVVCEDGQRRDRILDKYFTGPERRDEALVAQADAFIQRDADDEEASHGQHVTDAFFEADFFVDNTRSDKTDEDQLLDESLARLISIITHDSLIRPTIEETAMHHAHSARVRSACLSRQVGAALVDRDGTVVATGTNEVPRAGGGVYGERPLAPEEFDHRCAFREDRYCSNNKEQNRIIDELIESIQPLREVEDRAELRKRLRNTAVGQLIEFSRAVHAEMDALLSAGREGVSTVGTRLFVTTFPCHYCARHIVSAGIYEVQFIEPYPKSLALELHDDAIAVEEGNWYPPEETGMAEAKRRRKAAGEPGKAAVEQGVSGRVLFRPFVGVAPRLYLRAFEKTRRLKDKITGKFDIQAPEWGDEWSPFTAAYPELEAALTKTL
ncbi:anti-phage dCTP deaminase [Sphingobium estronivorans]|uniref:anti-phage dCTP deaminase n=1 Tax=Sphingobium estronivorans TaxID=1577690 RepID=UPI001238433D|nr:anti-phage dCTP deaminase [Sphingobium estronivorans]